MPIIFTENKKVYMSEKNQLPEGYIPIEYIEYRSKQERQFAYGRFERYKDALEFANHINAICKNDICKITTFQIPDNTVFCVVFPEHVIDIVNDIKIEDCTLLNPSINVVYNTPILYRFIDEKYVELFFEKGELKLTTFDNCKNLEDLNRKDDKEGRSDLFGYDGDFKVEIGFGVGSDVIMLCTSMCSDYKNDKGITYTKYIEIFNVQGLILAIAEQLSKSGYVVNSILMGPCFYSKKEFHKIVDTDLFREKLEKEQVFDWDEMAKITNAIGGSDIYFQKPIEKRFENEFRLLWIVDEINNNQNVFVTIPHPENYCRLINTNTNQKCKSRM